MKRDPLGANPLSQGIFTKTFAEGEKSVKPETINQEPQTINRKPETGNPKPATMRKGLVAVSSQEETEGERAPDAVLQDGDKEKITLDLITELNDWLDHLVRHGKKSHGHKIPKQKWIQAALEIMRSMPVDWEQVKSLEALREEVREIVDSKTIKQ